ncbi:MAG: TusE/DsrC/DsvC family sulfur relay protein [Gammaproteobacteria bacterium]|nr:TusE/DsrC/DsvC family sulfur relay protein [Gammaproteobacteria bacterium]
MSLESNGKTIETTASGFLVNIEDWDESVASAIAEKESLALTDEHWDLMNYLRDEFINNGGNQPNTRKMVKAMEEKWPDKKVDSKYLYILFPGDPSKQGGRIAGLPESRRKGGY